MQVIKAKAKPFRIIYTHHVLLMAAISRRLRLYQTLTPKSAGILATATCYTTRCLPLLRWRCLFTGVMLAGVAVMGRVILVDGADYPATAIACALYGFAGTMSRDAAVLKSESGGALSRYGYALLVRRCRAFTPRLFAALGIPTFP